MEAHYVMYSCIMILNLLYGYPAVTNTWGIIVMNALNQGRSKTSVGLALEVAGTDAWGWGMGRCPRGAVRSPEFFFNLGDTEMRILVHYWANNLNENQRHLSTAGMQTANNITQLLN